MKRRGFLQRVAGLAGSGMLPMTLIPAASAATPERFLVALSAEGGWDPTALVDPKGNIDRADGRGPVNKYQSGDIVSAGNLLHAPYAPGITPPESGTAGELQTFFSRHYQRLLVINGIDTQTNGHDSGRRFVWSGRLETGYPSIAALAAAPYAEQPMAFISNGGYDFTASLVASVRTASPKTFARLAYPNSLYAENADYRHYSYFNNSDYKLVQDARQARLQRLHAKATLPQRIQMMEQLDTARRGEDGLDSLLATLPASLSSGLKGQAEIAVAAFASGMAAGANLTVGGFDTHGNHDFSQTRALTTLLEGVDHLWNLIELHGLQDKVTVIIGSDFGRTPFYNSGNGKDHWNVTSMMAMGAGITGNRVIGATDENFEALKISPSSLQPHAAGITLTPRHIHRSLRDLIGVTQELDSLYPVVEESLPLFV